jgi:4-amino-4-deoxy-L-arabinose transferase-like glycosyltransferase
MEVFRHIMGADAAPSRPPWLPPWLLPVGLCLAINWAIALGIAVHQPEYLADYELCRNPDALDYVYLGRNFFLRGHYSRQRTEPYTPDILRTPVYPLFAGGLDLLGGAGAIYLAQGLLQAGSCLLLYLLVRSILGKSPAFWASLLMATDLVLAIANFSAMSEMLSIFFVLAACLALLPPLLALGTGPAAGISRWFVGGTLLGIAILTRPAVLYLPVVLLVALLAIGWARGYLKAALGAAATLLAALILLVGPWVVRNAVVCSVPRITNVDSNNLVYFFGAGAYQVRHGVSLEEAQDMIAREFHLAPYAMAQNPWMADRSVAEIDRELRQVKFQVLTKYPRELVIASLGSVLKASVSHNVAGLAGLLQHDWNGPQTSALLRADPAALDRLFQNGPLLTAVFFWECLHTLLTLVTGFLGVVVLFWTVGRRTTALVLVAVLAYFYLTVAMFGYEAFSRCRIPVLPFLYIFAGWGISWLANRRLLLRPAQVVA